MERRNINIYLSIIVYFTCLLFFPFFLLEYLIGHTHNITAYTYSFSLSYFSFWCIFERLPFYDSLQALSLHSSFVSPLPLVFCKTIHKYISTIATAMMKILLPMNQFDHPFLLSFNTFASTFNSNRNLLSKGNNPIMTNPMKILTCLSLLICNDINHIDKSLKHFNFILPYTNYSLASSKTILILFVKASIIHIS